MNGAPRSPGFTWRDGPSGAVLRCDALDRAARHAFTSRQLGLRGDDAAGWRRVAAAVDCADATSVHRTRQVHGAAVHLVTAVEPGSAARPEADALVTNIPGAALCVVTADCVPVLLADSRSGAVAAVHAGWRGTAADVVGAAVATLRREFGVAAADLVAAIGPSIGACCYEVGDELPDAFAAQGATAAQRAAWFSRHRSTNRWHLDLWRANADLLVRAGVPREHVHVAGLCTKHHLEWFESYRADGPNAGRLAAVIVANERRG